ncbi:MAG: hypothetical protein FJ026_17215 [Chloroflexi bacterium]|nr:hypothetical protein [Chloroflexota bacterium]
MAAFRWIRANPGSFVRLLPKKLLRNWTLSFGNEARDSGLPDWVSYLYLVFPSLGLVGLVLSLHHWKRLLPVYFLFLSSTLTTLVFYGSTRQSAILIPGVTILAAYALDRSSLLLRDFLSSGTWQQG